MKFLRVGKDGGPKSTVTGYWLIEIKWLFSIVLLRFDNGSRDEFHSHAFNSLNWVLKGFVKEYTIDDTGDVDNLHGYQRSIKPIVTRRSRFHRVVSQGTTWVLSIRGPWSKTWREYDPKNHEFSTLTHGRVAVK